MGPVGCAFLLSLLLGEPEVEVGGGRGFSALEVAIETTRTLHTRDVTSEGCALRKSEGTLCARLQANQRSW